MSMTQCQSRAVIPPRQQRACLVSEHNGFESCAFARLRQDISSLPHLLRGSACPYICRFFHQSSLPSSLCPTCDVLVAFSSHSPPDIVDVAGQSCLLSHKPVQNGIDEAEVLLSGPNTTFSMEIKPGKDGLYSILFANCIPGSSASYNLRLSLMNPGMAQTGARGWGHRTSTSSLSHPGTI